MTTTPLEQLDMLLTESQSNLRDTIAICHQLLAEKTPQLPDQIVLGGKEFRRAFDRVWVGPLMPLSDELCLALTEIERLRRWQREARYVIDAWDEVYQLVPEWFRAERLGVIHADIVKAYLRTLLDGEA